MTPEATLSAYEEKLGLREKEEIDVLEQKQVITKKIIEGKGLGANGENRPIDIVLLPPEAEVPPLKTILEKYRDQADVQMLILFLYRFLQTPLVLDGFDKDDVSRDAWEKKIAEKDEFGSIGEKIILRNRLRPNIINEAINPLSMLADSVPSAKLEQIVQKIPSAELSADNYKTKDFAEKSELVKKVTNLVAEALNALAS